MLAAAEEAKKKNLKVGPSGLQRQHQPGYLETIKRVQDGAIGDIMYGRTFWDMGAARPSSPGSRSGTNSNSKCTTSSTLPGSAATSLSTRDCITSTSSTGSRAATRSAPRCGGAEVRRGKDAGWLMDHYAIEFEYADGSRLFHQNRQIPDCWDYVAENAHGTLGSL